MKEHIWRVIALVEAVFIVAGVLVFVMTRPPHLYFSTEAKVEIFRALGGQSQHNMAAAEWNMKGKPIWTVISPYHVGLGFVGLDKNATAIYYIPDKNKYRIIGKAGICYPNGVMAKAEDTEIRAPGPPHHISGDRSAESDRCQRKAVDYFGARIVVSRKH